MNEQFLTSLQESPRKEFVDALYQKISRSEQPGYGRVRRLARWAVLAVISFALALGCLPPVRAYAQEWILQLSRLLISHQPTYAEQFEQSIQHQTPTVGEDETSAPIEWQAPPLLTLSEASLQAGFDCAEITRLSETFTLISRSVSLPTGEDQFTRVTTVYQSGVSVLVFSQTAYQPEAKAQSFPVGESPVTPLTVQAVEGIWIEHLRLSTYVEAHNQVAPQFANLLLWEKNGFAYWLQSTPGLSQEEMLTIANSVKP
jgi:hypothetical protein